MNEKIIGTVKDRLGGTLEICGETRFREDLPLTSFDYMVIVYNIEREFSIRMDFFEFSKCITLKDVSDLVHDLIDKKEGANVGA